MPSIWPLLEPAVYVRTIEKRTPYIQCPHLKPIFCYYLSISAFMITIYFLTRKQFQFTFSAHLASQSYLYISHPSHRSLKQSTEHNF